MEKTIFKICKWNDRTGLCSSIGTGFFISYEKDVYFVTASHVFEEFPLEENETYALFSSTVIKDNRVLYAELKQSIILKRKNNFFPYDYDIALGKVSNLALFEKEGYGMDVIDIEDGYYGIKGSDQVKVYGYPAFYLKQFDDREATEYILPFCFSSQVLSGFNLENFVVIENNTDVSDYKGMSGAPVYIEDKLAGVFCAGSEDLDGVPVLLFCPIWCLAFLINQVYKDLGA